MTAGLGAMTHVSIENWSEWEHRQWTVWTSVLEAEAEAEAVEAALSGWKRKRKQKRFLKIEWKQKRRQKRF